MFFSNRSTLSIEPQPAVVAVAAFHPNEIAALVEKLCGSNADWSSTEINDGKRKRRRLVRITGQRANAAQRGALLGGTVDEARVALLASWPFVKGTPLRPIVDTYVRLFDAAAAVHVLVSIHGISQTTIVDWLDDKLKSGRWPVAVSRATLQRNVSFLAARLARKGMLDANPARNDTWSLERAIRQHLVPPPSIDFLRSAMNMDHFDVAFGQLRAVWRRRAAPSIRVLRRKTLKD